MLDQVKKQEKERVRNKWIIFCGYCKNEQIDSWKNWKKCILDHVKKQEKQIVRNKWRNQQPNNMAQSLSSPSLKVMSRAHSHLFPPPLSLIYSRDSPSSSSCSPSLKPKKRNDPLHLPPPCVHLHQFIINLHQFEFKWAVMSFELMSFNWALMEAMNGGWRCWVLGT